MSSRSVGSSSDAILMIHGAGCGGEVWGRMSDAFRARGWRVETPTIRPELRVKSRPDAALPRLTLGHYVADMESAARRLQEESGAPPVVFGHSLGGLIALKLAERGAARAVVLLSPVAPAGIRPAMSVPFIFSFLFTYANLVLRPSLRARPVKAWETGMRWGWFHRVPREQRAALVAATRYCSSAALQNVVQPDKDPERTAYIDAGRVTVPVLTVVGNRDRCNPIGTQREVAAKYGGPAGGCLEYADNAHWLMDEPGTDRITDDIAAWLDRAVRAS